MGARQRVTWKWDKRFKAKAGDSEESWWDACLQAGEKKPSSVMGPPWFDILAQHTTQVVMIARQDHLEKVTWS